MTKRNKRSIETQWGCPTTRADKTKLIPIIIKCNCGDAIANTVEGSIGCIRYPDCCDEDLEFID